MQGGSLHLRIARGDARLEREKVDECLHHDENGDADFGFGCGSKFAGDI